MENTSEYIIVGAGSAEDDAFATREEMVREFLEKFSEMVESIIIKSYPYDGIFIDIGTPDDYLRLINEKNNENK